VVSYSLLDIEGSIELLFNFDQKFEEEEGKMRQFPGESSQAMHNNVSASSAFERNNFAIP